MRKKASDLNAKPDFNDYQSEETIAKNVSADDKEFHCLKAHATESYLIDNRKFGRFLAEQFEAMDRVGASSKLMLMTSTNHAMELSLRIKHKDGKKVYVARFFDPNQTTTHARAASDSLQAFTIQDLRGYLDENEDEDILKLYYPETKGLSVLYVYPGKDEVKAMASRPPSAAADRKLTVCIPDKEIDATAFSHLMANGFEGDLRRLKEEIARRPDAKRMALLAATFGESEAPILFMAILHGHAGAVEAWGEWLPLIPKKLRAELLAAKAPDGTPGLFMALLQGHTAAVEEFVKLLPLIPAEQWSDLLSAETAHGFPGLSAALRSGHAAAVKALFGGLLQLIPNEEQRAELLEAKTAGGTSGLSRTLQKEHAAVIKAFDDLLLWLPAVRKNDLLLDLQHDYCSTIAARGSNP